MRRKETQSLGAVIREMMNENSNLGRGYRDVEVVHLWHDLLGRTVSRSTRNIDFRNGILYVRLNSSIVRNEIFMMREQVRGEINRCLGEEVVKQIILQ